MHLAVHCIRQSTYTKGGWLGSLHEAVVTGLTAGVKYYYRVGSAQAVGYWNKPQW